MAGRHTRAHKKTCWNPQLPELNCLCPWMTLASSCTLFHSRLIHQQVLAHAESRAGCAPAAHRLVTGPTWLPQLENAVIRYSTAGPRSLTCTRPWHASSGAVRAWLPAHSRYCHPRTWRKGELLWQQVCSLQSHAPALGSQACLCCHQEAEDVVRRHVQVLQATKHPHQGALRVATQDRPPSTGPRCCRC